VKSATEAWCPGARFGPRWVHGVTWPCPDVGGLPAGPREGRRSFCVRRLVNDAFGACPARASDLDSELMALPSGSGDADVDPQRNGLRTQRLTCAALGHDRRPVGGWGCRHDTGGHIVERNVSPSRPFLGGVSMGTRRFEVDAGVVVPV